MTLPVPSPWAFVLLALAAYRLYRLGSRDTITEPIRAAVAYGDDEAVSLDDEPRVEVVGVDREIPKGWRVYLSTLVRCPWCAGFYVSVAVWAAWWAAPRWTMFLAAPWALSAVLGLAKKNLDA